MAAKDKQPLMQLEVLTSWEDFDLLEDFSECTAPVFDPQANAANDANEYLRDVQGTSMADQMGNSTSLDSAFAREDVIVQQDTTKQCSLLDAIHDVVPATITLRKAAMAENPQGLQSIAPVKRDVPAVLITTASIPSMDSSQECPTYTCQNRSPEQSGTAHGGLVELDFDSLCHCLQFLSLRDICMVAQCCKVLQAAAYSNSVWQALYRNQWPKITPPSSLQSQRALFFDRWKACCQLRFSDPSVHAWSVTRNDDTAIQVEINSNQSITLLTFQAFCTWTVNRNGSRPRVRIGSYFRRQCSRFGEKAPFMVPIDLPMLDFKGGGATSTGMGPRSAIASIEEQIQEPNQSVQGLESVRGIGTADSQKVPGPKEHFFLVSEDKVRLYSTLRGCCRTLLGGPGGHALCITDRVLALPPGSPEAVVATGGQDKVVRLWTLGARRKGEQRMVCSLRGHEDPVAFVAVARHNPSLLISVGNGGTVKLWDVPAALALWAATQSASKSCHATWKLGKGASALAVRGSVCYVACGTAVIAIDLIRLRILGPVAVHSARITAMALNTAGDRLCTGTALGTAFLWNPTRCDFNDTPKPLAELKSQAGCIRQILIDRLKVVVWEYESRANISDAETGAYLGCYPEVETFFDTDPPIAMRGPHLVLADIVTTSAEFSQATKQLESNTRDTEHSEADEVGRFWEKPNANSDALDAENED